MQINFSLNKKVLIVGLVILALVGSGAWGGLYVKRQIDGRDKKIADLEKQKIDLQVSLSDETLKRISTENEKNNAVNAEANFYLKLQVMKDGLAGLAKNFDDMDHLVLSDDQRNTQMVNWYSQNAEFTINDGTLATANVKQADWKEKQVQSVQEYRQIKSDTDTNLQKVLDELNFIDSASKKNNQSSGASTVN